MRTLTDHKLNGLNDAISITVLDQPGPGGASHAYRLELNVPQDGKSTALRTDINFQKGPIQEAGFNGWSQEALLAILIDRLRHFQAGPYACDENSQALLHAEMCLEALKDRTTKRLARGVEGTMQK